MKHSTNYFDTFIEIADDSPVEVGQMPPIRGEKKSIANMQFEMLYGHPYMFTSDEVIFSIHTRRKGIPGSEFEEAKAVFFSKGQPCFRASPLTKKYGWGIHSNSDGKIAIYGAETFEYHQFATNPGTKKVKAMRSKKAE